LGVCVFWGGGVVGGFGGGSFKRVTGTNYSQASEAFTLGRQKKKQTPAANTKDLKTP